MAARGYCTAAEVADFLGQTFTAGQTTHCNNLIEQAEVYIDEETGRGWLVGAQTDEAHYLDGSAGSPSRLVFLRYAPVASVEAITGRTSLGADETALVEDEDYEIRDLNSGLILLLTSSYDRLLVDYTPVDTLPLDLKKACIELVATWMQPHLQPGSFGVDSYSLPDLTVRYARSHVQAAIPPNVQRVIGRYSYPVHA